MIYKTLVRPEHLNHYGMLFGGYMLLWLDEYAYLAAMEEFPGANFVTRAMDAASFTKGVRNGDVLIFDINRSRIGHSSVTYQVYVRSISLGNGDKREVFNTSITFCNVDADGNKVKLPPLAGEK